MKNLLKLVTFCVLFSSCNYNQQSELVFLQKNAFQNPVWEEMLLQDKYKFSDVVLAFKAYASAHDLDKETIEHSIEFKKIIIKIS